ncbi:fam-d protein [Plasmodium yoelii yoelii]|nr:fam-d protein [Plasmodium yoelii yoelii]
MMNIILSFFILVISINVKGTTFQDGNNNIPEPIGYISLAQPIAYISLAQPTVVFAYDKKKHTKYLDLINSVLNEQSKNTIYEFEGGNYHWVITNFGISIDNSSLRLKLYFSEKEIDALKFGTKYFISYLRDNIKYLFSRYMDKYDFEKNYGGDLKKLAEDLKALIYDRLNHNFKYNLIKREKKTKDEKVNKKGKKIFKTLVHNSDIIIQGYFIKVRKDGNYTDLTRNLNMYFDININKDNVNSNYDLKFLKSEIIELVSKPLRRP